LAHRLKQAKLGIHFGLKDGEFLVQVDYLPHSEWVFYRTIKKRDLVRLTNLLIFKKKLNETHPAH
jgi:hypothetical protein